jgi:hypothetical protein
LLVVAVSVVNADDANPTTRELRTVLAGSAFVALVDIFLVSIVALTGGSVVFGLSSLAMATVGLMATRQLIPRAKLAGNFSRGLQARKLNIAFAAISVGAYSGQLGLAIALLKDLHEVPQAGGDLLLGLLRRVPGLKSQLRAFPVFQARLGLDAA